MLAIKGIYDGKNIIPLGNIPIHKRKKVIITFLDEPEDIENDEIRNMTSNSDAFEFWKDEREDLYQDYLNKE